MWKSVGLLVKKEKREGQGGSPLAERLFFILKKTPNGEGWPPTPPLFFRGQGGRNA